MISPLRSIPIKLDKGEASLLIKKMSFAINKELKWRLSGLVIHIYNKLLSLRWIKIVIQSANVIAFRSLSIRQSLSQRRHSVIFENWHISFESFGVVHQPVNSANQIGRASSIGLPKPATEKSKTNSEESRTIEQKRALQLLDSLSDIAKSFDDVPMKIKTEAQIADTLWDYDQLRARRDFEEAFQDITSFVTKTKAASSNPTANSTGGNA